MSAGTETVADTSTTPVLPSIYLPTLKKAFSGQLVAQDANDEPASLLLARIKAERVKSPQPPFAKGGHFCQAAQEVNR